MLKISDAVEHLVEQDELILSLGFEGLINLSSYARKIHPQIEKRVKKEVKEGSIVAALTRFFQKHPKRGVSPKESTKIIQSLAIHTDLEGMTFERTEEVSKCIKKIYELNLEKTKSFSALTHGLNEITLVCESQTASQFRAHLSSFKKIYDKKNLVGITIKFDLKYLELPNTIFELYKKLAYKKINIIEIISTATEITFIISSKELGEALEAFQKNIL